MHLRTLISLTVTALFATATPPLFPPFLFPSIPAAAVGSVVPTSLATVPIPSGVTTAIIPIVTSAVAAATVVPTSAGTDLIPGLAIPPTKLYDNILAAIDILYDVVALLNESGLVNVPTVNPRQLNLPGVSIFGGLGATITTLIGLVIPLLSLRL